MASPAAAGVAGLGLAVDQSLSSQDLRAALTESAQDIGLAPDRQGSGRVDAAALIDQVGGNDGGDGGNDGGDGGNDGGNDGGDGGNDGGDGGDEEQPACGGATAGGSVTSLLAFFNPSDRFVYPTQTEDPCQVEIDLDGPDRANFDLFVTLDGSAPTPDTADLSATTTNANENIVTNEVAAGQRLGILVEGISGAGRYELSVRELGR